MQNGLLISELRTKHGLSQRDVARYLNVPLSVYKLYETNLRPMKIQELNDLSNYFKVSLNTLLGLSNNLKKANYFDLDYKYLKFSLKYVRRMNRVSQKDLAKEFKLSIPTIARFEKQPERLKADYLCMFAKRFHVSVDYICGKTLKKEVL